MKEKELEDLICQHPRSILSADGIILGRQIPLAHGRLDILAWDYGQTFVIELKVRPLQEKDIGQVLRYTNDVKWHLLIAFQQAIKGDQCFDLETWRGNAYADKLMPYANATPGEFPAIQPMLIGPSADSTVLAAAQGADIKVMFWTADETKRQVELSYAGEHDSLKDAFHSAPLWASRIVERAQALAWDEADYQIDQSITQLFTETKQ